MHNLGIIFVFILQGIFIGLLSLTIYKSVDFIHYNRPHHLTFISQILLTQNIILQRIFFSDRYNSIR
jgi:hypothetical protein